jgi:hypothetical protein
MSRHRREKRGSSTPRLSDSITHASEYRVAGQSRAMTAESAARLIKKSRS